MGYQRTWEGGFNAPTLSGALSHVRQLSLVWRAKEIHQISVYAVDHNGVIESTPAIWQKFEAGHSLTTFHPHTHNEFEELPVAESKPNAAALYESADWMQETDIPARFETVRLKEQ